MNSTPNPQESLKERKNELRRYIAAHVIGDNPPPLTTEARDLIRAMLGTSQAGESSAETA